MLKKRILALALLLCMALALVACGSSPYKKVDLNAHISFGDFDYTKIGVTKAEYEDFMEAARRDLIDALEESKNLVLNSLAYNDKSQAGDRVSINYTGLVPVDGLSVSNLSVTVGTDVSGLPAGFDEALKGLEKDKVHTFNLTFPATDDIAQNLRGKNVWFTVTVTDLSCPHDLESKHTAAQEGDVLTISYIGREEYQLEKTASATNVTKVIDGLASESLSLPASIDEALIGLKLNEQTAKKVTFPQDKEKYGLMAGKEVGFQITVTSITCAENSGHEENHTDVQKGDTVVFSYTAEWTATPANSVGNETYTVGQSVSDKPAGFSDALVGMQKKGTKNVLLTYSADAAPELAGKEIQFLFTVVEIMRDDFRSVHAGDKIQLDYIGDVVEKIPTGEEKANVTEAKKLNVTAGEVDLATTTLPADFTAQIVGTHVGEQKIFYVTYPNETAHGDLAGKVVRFTVRVKAILTTTYKDVSDAASTVAAWRDRLNLDYSGVMVGETEPFKNGTATAQTLELGSKTFIDGFEAALIGAPLGVEIPIYLTFPDPYPSDTAKSGKDVVFYVTINSLKRLPDEMVTDEGKLVLTLEQINKATERTAEAGNLYADIATWEKEVAKTKLLEITQEKLLEASVITSYPPKEVKQYAQNYIEMYEMYASQMGYTLEGYVGLMGQDINSFYDTAITYAKSQVKNEMALLLVAEKSGITLSDEEFDAYVEENYEVNGYKSARQFKRKAGKNVIRTIALCEKAAEQLAQWAADYNSISIG